MTTCSVATIRAMIAAFDLGGLDCVDKLGTKVRSISDGVTKYSASVPELDYFIVFDKTDGGKDVSFIFDKCEISSADVEKEFGALVAHYNFRENYSELKISISSAMVEDLYFIKDNKFEIKGPGQLLETTPQGKATYHAGLEFNGFCLRLRPGRAVA